MNHNDPDKPCCSLHGLPHDECVFAPFRRRRPSLSDGLALLGIGALIGAGSALLGTYLATPDAPPAPARCSLGGGSLPSGDAADIGLWTFVCTDGTWVRTTGYGN